MKDTALVSPDPIEIAFPVSTVPLIHRVTTDIPAASEILVMSALIVMASPDLASVGLMPRLLASKFTGGGASLPAMAKVEKRVMVVV